MQNKKFSAYTDSAYIRDRRILLLKGNTKPFNSYWHLIGGHVEENETLKEALKREFKEETNLDITVGSPTDGRIEATFDRIKTIISGLWQISSSDKTLGKLGNN